MSLRDEVAGVSWYHTLELPGGIVTRGWFDLRSIRDRAGLPQSTSGMRCLDVGTADGFWAFEMERRGADEVVAVDLDDPRELDWQGEVAVPRTDAELHERGPRAFAIAAQALGSRVKRQPLSVYDLDPERVGEFDLVFIGNLLLHLRDPVGALEAIRSVVRGELVSLEPVALGLSLLAPRRPLGLLEASDDARWWTPNRAAHRRWCEAAGFAVVDSGGPVFARFGGLFPRWPRRLKRPLRRDLVFWLGVRRFGTPTQWVRARPRG